MPNPLQPQATFLGNHPPHGDSVIEADSTLLPHPFNMRLSHLPPRGRGHMATSLRTPHRSLLIRPGNHPRHCGSQTCQNQARAALSRGRRTEKCSFPCATDCVLHTHLPVPRLHPTPAKSSKLCSRRCPQPVYTVVHNYKVTSPCLWNSGPSQLEPLTGHLNTCCLGRALGMACVVQI